MWSTGGPPTSEVGRELETERPLSLRENPPGLAATGGLSAKPAIGKPGGCTLATPWVARETLTTSG